MDVDFGFDFDADSEDAAGNQQMIYKFDTIVPGASFELSFRFESYATELARATMLHALRLWQEEGVIGGMSAAGLGRIDIDADLSEADRYVEYVEQNGDDIIEALETIANK